MVGDKGEQLGIMPIMQARETARKANLDLVEVAPTSVPPVCRLLDYGKFKYEQQKKEQVSKKAQKVSMLREIRMRPKIGIHDFDAKARTARKLLGDGAKVKVTLMFRGREITHPELGWKILQRMAEKLSDVAALERQAVMEGRRMDIILSPATTKTREKAETRTVPKADARVKTEAKATVKAKEKTEAGTEPEADAGVKTEAKATVKAEEKTEAGAEPKTDAGVKTEAKATVKTEKKTEEKVAAKEPENAKTKDA
ncbi:MAG: translation initiation factor IF-3 [Dehalococcoidales bacterium]|nr:translation initiation factor IF-3 [Dehalococcoidales bacterium]